MKRTFKDLNPNVINGIIFGAILIYCIVVVLTNLIN
jgi:hypothetical protein